MNEVQRSAILVGCGLIVLMVVYPPWNKTFNQSNDGYRINWVKPAEYRPIFRPPEIDARYGLEIDLTRLVVQLGTVVLVTTGCVLAFSSKPKSGC